MSEIINKIETERKRRGWNIYRLSKESGVSQQTIHAAITTGGMTVRTAEALMRTLGLEVRHK